MKHFQALFEHTLDRFNFGGIQIQDYVKILDTKVDGATEDYIKELEEFKADDLNIKVLEVVSSTAEDGRNQPNTFSVVIGQEMASGLYPRKITVPVKHLKVIGYAQPPSIPDSWKHTNKSDRNGEPEPLKAENK
jgi:hypothetical protein